MVFEHCDPAAPMMPQRWHRYTLPDNVAPVMSSGHVSGQTIQGRNTACACGIATSSSHHRLCDSVTVRPTPPPLGLATRGQSGECHCPSPLVPRLLGRPGPPPPSPCALSRTPSGPGGPGKAVMSMSECRARNYKLLSITPAHRGLGTDRASSSECSLRPISVRPWRRQPPEPP